MRKMMKPVKEENTFNIIKIIFCVGITVTICIRKNDYSLCIKM